MKLTTWNVNSVNARIEHLVNFIKKDLSDIYLLQELKCTNDKFPYNQIEDLGYHVYVNGQKAWNGVALLSKKKLKIDDIYTCFHNDEDKCKCRKPKRGLIFKAKKKWNIDLKKSYIIGDRWRDIELANKLKMKCFYIDYNYNEKKPKKYNYKVKSLLTAVRKLKTNEK